MFAATGVTNGTMLQGVRRFAGGAVTHSMVMRSKSGTVRLIEAHHNFNRKDLSQVRRWTARRLRDFSASSARFWVGAGASAAATTVWAWRCRNASICPRSSAGF